jgi:hypothetical protein
MQILVHIRLLISKLLRRSSIIPFVGSVIVPPGVLVSSDIDYAHQ